MDDSGFWLFMCVSVICIAAGAVTFINRNKHDDF